MQREDLFTEIILSNLNQTHVSKIAESMIGGAVSAELASKLAEEGRGNALFVVESLKMLSERGSLCRENGEWRLSVDVLGIPKKLKDIILSRLGGLKFSQRRVLDAASVIGERFDVELLSAMLSQDNLEVLEALNIIAQASSLISVEEDFFKFDHAKSRQAIYEEIPRPLKKGYHTRVAEKLESRRIDGGLPFAEISYHYAQAGNKEKAVKNAIAAGQNALARFSNVEAIKHLSYVLETLPESPENTESKRDALEALGDAYYANCMYKEALTVFERLAISETGKARLRAYRKALDAIFFGRGDPTYFMELAKKAEPYAAFDRLESARIRFHKASYLPRAMSEIEWEEALQVFEEEYSLPDVARTLSALGVIKALIHPDEQGLTAILRSAQMAEESGDLHGMMRSSTWVGIVFYGLGFSTEACQILAKSIQIGERVGAYGQLAMSSMYLSQVQEQQGLLEEAVSTSLKALEYDNKAGKDPTDLILANFVRFYAKLGNSEASEENYWKLMNSPPKPGPADNINLTREFYIARAQTAFFVLKNRWDEARQSLEKAFEISKRIANVTGFARDDQAWVLSKQGRIEEAKVLIEENKKAKAEIEKRFARINIQASLMAPREVVEGEEFEMRLDLVNVSKKPGLLDRVDYLIPLGFKVKAPDYISLEDGHIELKRRTINPFSVEPIKLRLEPSNIGIYTLNPQVAYIDESGELRICKPKTISITVRPSSPQLEILPGRVSTGFQELDALLLGGLPEKYAIALTSPSTEEREQIVRKFLEAGVEACETTFHVSAESDSVKHLIEKSLSSFFLFLANPQADSMIQSLPNVFKLKGFENLTEIDIALTKTLRTMNHAPVGIKRICLGIVSDVLLQHHALTTRRWLSGLLPTLKSRGFTTLAVVDPQMHPYEEVQAILGLFDGEIIVTERETAKGTEKVLRIKKLSNQKYLQSEVVLNQEK
jgi:tetratricopeptide (TPR) repeat protein/KaiC/GvpD/RAD55 family RecA-like ATPase